MLVYLDRQMKISFSFQLDLITTFEILGLSLAFIGFFNLSTHLERAFLAMQRGLWSHAKWKLAKRNERWPPHRHWRVILIEALIGWTIASIVITLIVVWLGWWLPLREILLARPLWQLVVGAIALMIAIIPYELVVVFGASSLTAGLFYLVSRVFWLLSLPPAGMTGTIGLLITIITFVLGRVVWPTSGP